MSFVSLFAASQSTPSSTSVGMDAILVSMIIILFFFIPITYAISSYLLMRIFRKADIEGWKAWVPVYNTWKTFEIGEQPGYWAILMFIPIINIVAVVFLYIAYYRIGLSLSKSGAFVLLAIFLPIVWMVWLAFDSSTWKGADGINNVSPPFTPPTFAPPQPPINS